MNVTHGEMYKSDVTKALLKAGFSIWHTGGNCRAVGKKTEHHEIYVTDGDLALPVDGETCHIGLYTDADDFYAEIESVECPSSECAARAIEMAARVAILQSNDEKSPMKPTQEQHTGPATQSWYDASAAVDRHKAAHAVFAVIGTVVLLPLAVIVGAAFGTKLFYDAISDEIRGREFQFEWKRRYARALKALKETE